MLEWRVREHKQEDGQKAKLLPEWFILCIWIWCWVSHRMFFQRLFFFTKANLKDPKRTRKEIEAMSGKDTLKGVTKHVQNVLVWGRDSEYTNCHKGAWKIKKCNGGFQCFLSQNVKALATAYCHIQYVWQLKDVSHNPMNHRESSLLRCRWQYKRQSLTRWWADYVQRLRAVPTTCAPSSFLNGINGDILNFHQRCSLLKCSPGIQYSLRQCDSQGYRYM